jgi:hypothetical protein
MKFERDFKAAEFCTIDFEAEAVRNADGYARLLCRKRSSPTLNHSPSKSDMVRLLDKHLRVSVPRDEVP